jgi:hypothetical protein
LAYKTASKEKGDGKRGWKRVFIERKWTGIMNWAGREMGTVRRYGWRKLELNRIFRYGDVDCRFALPGNGTSQPLTTYLDLLLGPNL